MVARNGSPPSGPQTANHFAEPNVVQPLFPPRPSEHLSSLEHTLSNKDTMIRKLQEENAERESTSCLTPPQTTGARAERPLPCLQSSDVCRTTKSHINAQLDELDEFYMTNFQTKTQESESKGPQARHATNVNKQNKTLPGPLPNLSFHRLSRSS
jgi:arginine deiminase